MVNQDVVGNMISQKLDVSLSNRIKFFQKKIELRDSQKEKIQKSHQWLRKQYLDKFDYVEKIFLTGSYKKNTIINQADNDVDMFVVLKGYDEYSIKPNTILDKLKNDLQGKYTQTKIKQNRPCIVLNFNHMTFELTPVIQVDNSLQLALGFDNTSDFYIPNTSNTNEWMQTENPRILEQKLSKSNANLNYQLVPLIKMMKKCKENNNMSNFQSFELEQLAIDNLQIISNYRDGIEQLLRIYNWNHSKYTYDDIEKFSDIEFAKFCNNIFGDTFPKTGV